MFVFAKAADEKADGQDAAVFHVILERHPNKGKHIYFQ
jgi:hypothetical protein